MPKIWPRYAQDLSMIYPIYTQDIAKICPIIFQGLPKIWPRYAQDMPKKCPRHAQDMPKICPRYPQDMVGIGKSGVWQYGLLGLVEPCSNKKPEASYTDCPNCQHLWRTLYELLWTFYEHFLRIMLKFVDFPQTAGGLVCFPISWLLLLLVIFECY